MSENTTCPGCGTQNPAGADACAQCNFPLSHAAPPAAPPPAKPVAESKPFDPGPRPVRPRRSRPDAMQPVQMQLWLAVGVAIVGGIIYFAAQGFRQTNVPTPVPGAAPEQLQRAELARKVLAKDSTNLAAQIELGNVLYDTANWSEAIIHYKSAARLDPQRSTTIVDLGVCYYNLGQFAAAESLFTHALTLDPNQVVALFNLGIVSESQEHFKEAQEYYHRAMQLNPPEPMKQSLMEHLQTVMQKTGTSPPPLGK